MKLGNSGRLIALTCVLASGFLVAESARAEASEADWRNMCAAFSKLGGQIMDSRQSGVSMSTMMESVSDGGKFQDLSQDMVVEAFKQPRYETKEMRERAVSNFKDSIYLQCFQVHANKKS